MDMSVAIDATFNVFGVAAAYVPPTPPGADSVAVTILSRTNDADLSVGLSRARVTAGVFEVRAAEIAEPAKGGTFTIGAAVWKITDAPEAADPDRLVWTLHCERTA